MTITHTTKATVLYKNPDDGSIIGADFVALFSINGTEVPHAGMFVFNPALKANTPSSGITGAIEAQLAPHLPGLEAYLSELVTVNAIRQNSVAVSTEPLPPFDNVAVNSERDRRIAAGFLFGGKMFDFDNASKQRVTGAGTLAGFAIGAGAKPGNLRWHGGDSDFAWIAQDNSLVTMDAPTCFMFGKAAAEHESRAIFNARMIKQMDPIPSDFADNSYWA